MEERLVDTVEFYVTTTVKRVVSVDEYAAAVSEGRVPGDGVIKNEIPEDRPGGLTAIAVYSEGEFVAEYDDNSPFVTNAHDRDAIVIAAMAAGVELPDAFAAPGGNPSNYHYKRLTFA